MSAYSLLFDHGFTRVVTPADMVGAYYGRLGFTRDGETGSWSLEL